MMSAASKIPGPRRKRAGRDGTGRDRAVSPSPAHRCRIVGIVMALVAAVTVSHVSSGSAQVTPPGRSVTVVSAPRPDPVERGWIGVNVDVRVREGGREPGNLQVRVVYTVDGGPAARVGIVPGDLIRAIDGELLTIDRWQNFTQNLRRGVDLRLTLDRAGRSREVRLTTATRPSLAPVPIGLTAHLDSVRTSFKAQLESGKSVWGSRDYVSLLIAGTSVEELSTRILDQVRQNASSYGFRLPTTIDIIAPPGPPGNGYSVVWDTDSALPFDYLMLQSPEADSVKTAMIYMRGELSQVTEATRAREQEIRELVEVTARQLGDNDAELLRLRSDNERVHRDLERLAVRLAEIGSNERETRRQATEFGAELAMRIRPVTAHVVGRNFVGGAQFNDLNPQLGTYFGTDRGVLVIQVLSGTPCDVAGLVPGDVVTHVGGTEIDSVESFRAVLNEVFAGRRRAELMLLRRGERVTATLSR